MKTTIPEMFKVVECIKPQTMGSARTGDWISLRKYARCTFIVHVNQGHASGSALTVDQAQDVGGSGEDTGITLANNWSCEDAPGTSDTWTKGASASSVTTSDTGSGSSMYMIQVDADELDDGFTAIQLEAGASNASNILSAIAILTDARYQAESSDMPSAIVD